MDSKFYKYCAVPLCQNTTIKTPQKLFVYVPKQKAIRKQWFQLAKRDKPPTSKNVYICEDHFDASSQDTTVSVASGSEGLKGKTYVADNCIWIPTDMLLSKMNSETSIDKSESMEEETVSPKSTMHCQPNETIDKTKEDLLKSKSVSSTESASGVLAPYLCNATDTIITKQLQNICRLCLKEKGTWDLTRPYISDTGEEVFNDMLWDCFGLKMPRLTCCGVSKLICSNCAASLQQAYNFKQQVVLASATFNSYCDRNLEDTPESEEPIYKSGANSKTPLLRQFLQTTQQNINYTEKINENDHMSTPTPTDVHTNAVIDHSYSKSGQGDKPTSTENKIKELHQKTSEETQIQPQRNELPVDKSIRNLPTTTKKAGNTGRIVKKSVRRITKDIDPNNRKLSARNPKKSGNTESVNPINSVEDTVNEVEFDTVMNDAEADTVINEDQLDIPIKDEWEIPITENNEPSSFQVSRPDDDNVLIKEEYDLEIKDEFDKYRTGMEDSFDN